MVSDQAGTITRAIAKGQKPEHTLCEESRLASEIKLRASVTQQHIDLTNNEILTIKSQWQTDEDLVALTKYLVSAQELAANISWLLSLTKDKIRIKDSQEYAAKVTTERKAKSEAAADENEKKARLAAERADPRLRERRKAIEGLIAMNIAPDVAESMIPQITQTQNKEKVQ